MKNKMKIFIMLLIAALSFANANAQPACPGILTSGACIQPAGCWVYFQSSGAEHSLYTCTGGQLFFDIINPTLCGNWMLTTDDSNGDPSCSSFPGTGGAVSLSSVSPWDCTFNTPGTYTYVVCLSVSSPAAICPSACEGCITITVVVGDELPFSITGPNNNCLD